MPGIGSIRVLPGGRSVLVSTTSYAASVPTGTPTQAGPDAIHGGGPSTATTITSSAGSASPSPSQTSPVTFSLRALRVVGGNRAFYDSSTQNNNEIILTLRTIIGGQEY